MPKVDWPPPYLVKQGKRLAECNKKAAGTPNKNGEFYRAVKKCLAKKSKK
jgi:hypothetical protein